MNEERLNYVQHYLKLSEKLRHIRKENAGAESVEEDELLEEMDVKPRLDQILDRINDFSRTTNFLSELHASDSIIIKINDDRMPSTINYSPIIQAMNNKLATTVLFKNLLISFKDYL